MIPLGLLKKGDDAEIMDIKTSKKEPQSPSEGGAARDGLSRLEDMGLRKGKWVRILSNEMGGLLLVKVDESRIAMSRGTAMRILVKRRTL
jgi:ferrous iron transport protein A